MAKASETAHLKFIVNFDEINGSLDDSGLDTYTSFLEAAKDVNQSEVRKIAESVKPDDVINLQFTSGIILQAHQRFYTGHGLTRPQVPQEAPKRPH